LASYQQQTTTGSDRLVGNKWVLFKLHGAI